MNNRILIFDTKVSGHHMEYVHHLLQKANSSDDEYIFYLPKQFEQVKGEDLNWNYGNNITFYFFDSEKVNKKTSLLTSSYENCRLLKRALKAFEVTHVFLITLIDYIPFLPFIISGNIKVSGIIYQIYLYRWKSASFLLKILDVCKYLILSYSRCIDCVYILNDMVSVRLLNQLYHSKKYTFLVDPYVPLKDKGESLSSLGIKEMNTVYFHFGSLAERKGTLEILEAIKLIKKEYLLMSTFVFAGKISSVIKKDFYRLVREIRCLGFCQVIVLDKFCDYGLIAELCKRSDILLMPYKVVSQSSGVIGYAAQYDTPVLAPAKGLIGKLVKKYQLGYLIDEVTPDNIAEFINKGLHNKKKISTEYLKINTVDNFINMIQF